MLLTDWFYLMHTEQKNNNMKCRLISLKIQQLISIFIFFLPATKIAPESNLFCNQGEIHVVRSLRKTNKKTKLFNVRANIQSIYDQS